MESIRTVSIYSLNKGSLMARGLYNISSDNGDVSVWFDHEDKEHLLSLTDIEFIQECEDLLNI